MPLPNSLRITLSGSAQSLSALLGLVGARRYYSYLKLTHEIGGAGLAYGGGSGVLSTNYSWFLTQGSSIQYGPFMNHRFNSDELYIVGTSGDKMQVLEV